MKFNHSRVNSGDGHMRNVWPRPFGNKCSQITLVLQQGSGGTSGESSREECPVCRRTFGSLAALIAHSREHDPETGEDMTPCPHCRKMFRDAVLLVAHVENEHSTSTGCVVC